MSPSWWMWALLSALFAAITAILIKAGLRDVNADFATLIRTAVILFALGTFVAVQGNWSNPFHLDVKPLLFLTASGLATCASWVCYSRALKIGDASKVDPIDKLSVVLVALLAFAFLGERPQGREWLGILMIGAGALALAMRK
jgi:bacterial/archaeal transporter family protein